MAKSHSKAAEKKGVADTSTAIAGKKIKKSSEKNIGKQEEQQKKNDTRSRHHVGSVAAHDPVARPAAVDEVESEDEKLHGFIFMCNRDTKPLCFNHRVFGLPSDRLFTVKKIKRGTKLFLYDFSLRLLHGEYVAVSNGEMNLVPHAFGGKFPAQVKFDVSKEGSPIRESDFKSAIVDNYNGFKFRQELTKEQVKKLAKLFRSSSGTPVSEKFISTKRVSRMDVDKTRPRRASQFSENSYYSRKRTIYSQGSGPRDEQYGLLSDNSQTIPNYRTSSFSSELRGMQMPEKAHAAYDAQVGYGGTGRESSIGDQPPGFENEFLRSRIERRSGHNSDFGANDYGRYGHGSSRLVQDYALTPSHAVPSSSVMQEELLTSYQTHPALVRDREDDGRPYADGLRRSALRGSALVDAYLPLSSRYPTAGTTVYRN